MIVLDTNVLSELGKARPSSLVQGWFQSVDLAVTFLCGPVIMEQAYGAEKHYLRSGSRRYLDSLMLLKREYESRTLALDAAGGDLAGRLRARRDSIGRPLSIGDAMIAAICLVHGATLATRNVRDFDGLDLKLVNPFEAAA